VLHFCNCFGMVEEGGTALVPQRRTNKLWSVCVFILVVEACERLCYYSIGGTQRNYLTFLGYGQGQASAINSSFTMLSYLSCFLGGYLADNWLGRYRTIFWFAIAYFIGTAMVAVASVPGIHNLNLYLVGTMVFIAIGTGAIKPNVMNFGASQYDENIPQEKVEQKSFFSYFYMMINLGAGVSFGFLSSVATSKADGSGYVVCYSIACGCMGVAVLFFLAGSWRYKPEPKTVHKPMISVIVKHLAASAGSFNGFFAMLGWILILPYLMLSLLGSIIQGPSSQTLTDLSMYMCLVSCLCLLVGHTKNDWIRDLASPIPGAAVTAQDIRQTMALVPQLLLVNIGFNVCYNAMNNAYPALACQMDLDVFGTQLNGAFTNLGDCLAIIIGVPIIEGLVMPFLEKRLGRRISRNTKYIWGFSLAILANASAVGVEYIRRQADFKLGVEGVSLCAPPIDPPIHMSNVSCFLAFIPMVITGIAEILVNPVIYQFAFIAAPPQLISVVQSFNLVVAGAISNAITGPLANAVFPTNLNQPQDPHWGQCNVTDTVSHGDCTCEGPGCWNAAGGCGSEAGIKGCGDVNITFYLNMAIGFVCLVLFLIVENLQRRSGEVEEEDLTLEEDDGHHIRSFIASGERQAVVVG